MKKSFVLLTTCVLALAACDRVGEGGDVKAIVVADRVQLTQTVSAGSTEGLGPIDFTTIGAWESSVREVGIDSEAAPEWITVSPAGGDKAGDYSMKISLQPNTGTTDRRAEVSILCEGAEVKATIIQKKPGGSISEGKIDVPDAAQLKQTISADGTSGKSSIEFTTDGPWSATVMQQGDSAGATAALAADEELWISISPDHGDAAGTYTMNITLRPNESPVDRAAIITIKCGEAEIEAQITQEKAEGGDQPAGRLLQNITKSYMDSGRDWETSIDFKYDSHNRLAGFHTISKNIDTGEEEGEATISVTYEAGKVFMRMESSWYDSFVDPESGTVKTEVGGRMVSELTATLNADGYVELAEGPIIYYDTDQKGEEYEYDRETMTYTAQYSDGYMNSVSVKNENPDPANLYLQKMDFICHWTNGNMTRVDLTEIYRDDDGTTNSALTGIAEYESGVKNASCNLDINWIIVSSDAIARIDDSIMCMMGLCGTRSNYLISRTYDIDQGANVNVLQYEYQTDSEGYVMGITVSQENHITDTYTLTY